MNKKQLLRKARKMAQRRGLEDKLIPEYKGGFRMVNPYRSFIKKWVKLNLSKK